MQRWSLRQVWRRIGRAHQAAHGFVRRRSIVTNARAHAGAHVVVKMDLRGFFPSVEGARVRGLLVRAGVPRGAAEVLMRLATEPTREGRRVLPQGAATSPAITNLLCRRMDRRLAGLAERRGVRFTRYADDLTFSWRPSSPAAVAPRFDELVAAVRRVVRSEGFEVHEAKTRRSHAGGRLVVTGLVVNEAPGAPPARVPRDVVRRLRAAIHNREHGRAGRETLSELRGLAAFVHSTDPRKGAALLERLAALEEKEARQ